VAPLPLGYNLEIRFVCPGLPRKNSTYPKSFPAGLVWLPLEASERYEPPKAPSHQ